ncbi:MAG TPA: carboxypeptidase regulatory-like domain-containing protein [Candidatus Binatia bacterium]|nr:carboxypeptidase regulatory-like domain-containing protein [Candidatus Binatia bacterium]
MTAKTFVSGMLTLLVIALLMAPSLMAQSLVSGDLTGTITDPTGAVVPNATVTLKNDSTGATRAATSNSSGAYRFSLLPPGTYTVTATAQGFSKAQTQTTVNVGQATIADVKLALGTSSQTVEVSSAAPLVQPDNADLSTNFNQTMIANQPNGGNDLTYIAQSAPGATMNTGMGYGNFSSFGLPATSNLFTVNGENDMDPYLNLNNSGATNLTLGKNDVQEATVVNNAYSGQYGQQAGAQVSYVTKSGTNAFHGNAEYWWTGRYFDANDWFNKLNGVPRPFANNNEWAASLGGPIKKDKLFFFLDHEGIRYIVPSSTPVFAWSPNFVTGALANIAATAPNELGLYQKYFQIMQAAPGYATGATAFGAGDGGCDAPVTGNCVSQYQATPAEPGTEWILSGRIDYNLSDRDHLFWRVRMDHGTQATYADPINNAFSAASYQPAYDGQGQWTHTFSPDATNQFIYAGSYYRAIFTQNNPGLFPFDVIGAGFNLSDLGGLVFDFPQGRNVTQYQIVDDLSLTKGAHSLKFGVNFRRYDITDFTFSVLNNPEVLLLDQGDFFNGLAFQTRQRFPSRATEPVALWGMGIYGQDEWRVSKSLKLTLAIRGEHNSNPVCQLDCASLLTGEFNQMLAGGLITPATPYNQMILANRHQLYRDTDMIDISPRFGFAWSPGGSDRTVLRGGFGIFYDAFPAVVGDNFMLNPPNVITVFTPNAAWGDTTTTASPYLQGAASASAIRSGFSSGASWDTLSALLGAGFRTPNFVNQAGTFHTPYYEQWSLQIQQALGDRSSLSLGYVGNHGVRIPIDNAGLNGYLNPITGGSPYSPFGPTPPTGCANGSCSQSLTFAQLAEYYSGGISNYNGLTATYSQRLTYGFTVQANYTWSHAMDEVSNGGINNTPFNNGTAPSLVYQLNPVCLRCNNYGDADYDVRHYFSASYVWQTPWKFGNKFVNGAIGGWTISQNFFARTGLPLSVIDGNNLISNWAPNNGANVAQIVNFAEGSCVNGLSQCLNAANFTTASGTFPNQRRNMFRGPGFFDSDFTINKNFKLTERMAFGIGANFYNIFNHPNFDLPDNNIADAAFGTILQTTAPPTGPYGSFFPGLPSGRIIQFQGKLVF